MSLVRFGAAMAWRPPLRWPGRSGIEWRPNIYVHRALACGLICLGLSNGVHAETISYADAATKLATDCGADIQKLCKGINLGNNRIRDCLAQHAAQVSPQCSSSLTSVLTSIQRRQQAQANVLKVCRDDARRRCEGVVPGEAHILNCLLTAARSVSAKCNAAITDAGWR